MNKHSLTAVAVAYSFSSESLGHIGAGDENEFYGQSSENLNLVH
jgi:hypothetical protein